MILSDMRLEVKSRLNGEGYRFLGDTRVNRFINQARAELDRGYLWPYREKTTSGAAPLAIADLGPVQSVVDVSNSQAPLDRVDVQTLIDLYGDLTTAGSPLYYYVASASGTPTVTVYPVAAHTISVAHWRVPADLVADGDSPVAPADFHMLIVDKATQIALRANREWRQAQAMQDSIDLELNRMLETITPGQPDGPDSYVGVTGASEDW